MALDGIKVEHAALDRAACDMQSTVKKIDDRMTRLEQELHPLRDDWAGAAQHQYKVAKHQWDQAIREMRQLLDATQVGVARSNADYLAADRRGAAAFEI